MRIIAGQHKGRRVNPPKNLPVRPTTDRAKEALFSILSGRFNFHHCTILDLFAGTGAISFEFASRGAPTIVAVDSYFQCTKFIEKTAGQLSLNISSVTSKTLPFLKKHKGEYDIIFADPPYAIEGQQIEQLHHKILNDDLLKPHGVFVLEHSSLVKVDHLDHLEDQRKYGSTTFSFFSRSVA